MFVFIIIIMSTGQEENFVEGFKICLCGKTIDQFYYAIEKNLRNF